MVIFHSLDVMEKIIHAGGTTLHIHTAAEKLLPPAPPSADSSHTSKQCQTPGEAQMHGFLMSQRNTESDDAAEHVCH